jgi:hypothetical protein
MGRTLKQLIESYRTDPHSKFPELQHQVRTKHVGELTRLSEKHGSSQLRDIRFRTLTAWYRGWLADGKIEMARSFVARLRELFHFGSTMLEDGECDRLSEAVSKLQLETSPPRMVQMTADHARAIRKTAHEHFGWGSIALAQALQFELLLGQKDVIGEWVPVGEPGESDVIRGDQKWLRGLRWSNINRDLILRHSVGSGGRKIEVDLKTAPMVLEELKDCSDVFRSIIKNRNSLPLVICDTTGMPWSSAEFRRKWRLVAKKAGVPDNVTNRDSFPAGMIRGGPDRAKISQTYTLKRIDYSLRTARRMSEDNR